MYFSRDLFWTEPAQIPLFIVSLVGIVFFRYVLFAVFVKIILRHTNKADRNSNPGVRSQVAREVRLSFYSSIIFSLLAVATVWLYQQGFTKIYVSMNSAFYFLISIPVFLFVYETYYYWLHRWMHRPNIFRFVHRHHHESIVPTVFAGFAFHPLEAFAQFIFFPVALMIFPMHIIALGVVFLVLTIFGTLNHSGFELFSNRLSMKWLIGSSHHDVHHRNFKTNFGLCLTFWDRFMNTNKWK
jgi:Delta7-sterol 5-desaturase